MANHTGSEADDNQMRSFTLRDHTADVAVEAEADSLGDVFAAVADGMAAAMAEGDTPESGCRFTFSETAENLPAALYDYLDRLIYERDVRGVLPVDNQATVEPVDGVANGDLGAGMDAEWQVHASARGVPLADVDARDLKAVTYSDMVIEERADHWHAYVVFDV